MVSSLGGLAAIHNRVCSVEWYASAVFRQVPNAQARGLHYWCAASILEPVTPSRSTTREHAIVPNGQLCGETPSVCVTTPAGQLVRMQAEVAVPSMPGLGETQNSGHRSYRARTEGTDPYVTRSCSTVIRQVWSAPYLASVLAVATPMP